MKWLEKKTDKGLLKYRMPNILEAYDILEASGISTGENKNHISLKRNVIKAMSSIVDVSLIDEALCYDDILNMVDDFMVPLSEIADEIIIKTFESFKKKSS